MRDILLVEDDDDIRVDLAAILEEAGYRVAKAQNGKEALDYLKCGHVPSLILLDLMMPVMNGWEFRFEQQLDPKLAPIPVVIFSAATDVPRTTESLRAASYVTKPFDLDVLFSAIHRYC